MTTTFTPRACTLFILWAGFCCSTPAVAQRVASDGLPLQSITLYRSGVGYFERKGSIKPGDSVQLRFANDEINDMLKSMVILDPQQALQVVSYESKEPLAHQLASFGVDLSGNPSLAELLGRMRGTRAKFVTGDGTVSGVILGGEVRHEAHANAQEPVEVPYINVVTTTGLRAVNLSTMVSVEIEDAQLNAELMGALAALASHTSDRFKTVDLIFAGTDARNVIVSYVNEMPIWKTSYRLVLADEGKPSEKPLIQGWAIVENTTDDDWDSVALNLVASQPVSFQMDLSESLHITRPELPVPVVAQAAPRIYQDGDAFEAGKALRMAATLSMDAPGAPPAPTSAGAPGGSGEFNKARRKAGTMGGGGGFGGDASGVMGEAGENDDKAMWRHNAIAQAQSGSIGEAFQYSLRNPISLPRRQSAMLPILSADIDGRRVSIFNRNDGITHPMRGVELKNTTGLQMIPGPIAVFDGYAYAGDAEVGYMTLGDTRLLAYSVDLSVAAAVQEKSDFTVRSLRIVDGVIEQTNKRVNTISYAFHNKDEAHGRTMLVECQKLHDWALIEPKKAATETQDLYRFELPLKPAEKATLTVVQEHTDFQRMGVVGFDLPTLITYSQEGKASAAMVAAVRRAGELQGAINDTSARISRLQAERAAIGTDQDRIRQNMDAIDHASEVYRRYLTKFGEQESRLEAIRDEETKEQETLAKQQQVLVEFVRTLNVA